ncbi:hypothetical protein KAR91_70155, partial [Candidatus Pacearchaeota archaeon]|nr:hypothetical protein [Candidatus Pacearchaeota archaeon]
NSEFTDNFTVVLTNVGSSGAISVASDETVLAIVKTHADGDQLDTSAWSRDGVTAVDGVIDLRASYSLKVDPNVLDDQIILFRDRASTGANAFSQNIDFSGTTGISGPINFTNTNNVNLAGVSNTTFKVGVGTLNGGAGVNVLTAGDLPTVPKNFRISDNNPYDKDHQAKVSEVAMKWNWVGLTGKAGSGTLVIDGVVTGEDALATTSLNELVGYEIYSPIFTTTDNTYDISGSTITSGGSTTLTCSGISAGEDPVVGINEAIIRSKASGYSIKVVPFEDSALVHEKARFYNLDDSYNLTQKYTIEIPLESTWELSIQSTLGSFSSGYVIMAAGTYDPDGAGGQSSVNYTSPYLNALPPLDDTNSGVTVLATNAGFDVTVDGWTGTDINNTPHEFEFAWSTADTLDWNNVTGSVQRTYQLGRSYSFASPTARAYQVGARPIQNKQSVGTEQVSGVVSGGGGALPGDLQAFTDLAFDIRTFSCSSPTYVSDSAYFDDVIYKITPQFSPSGSTEAVAAADITGIVTYLNGGHTSTIKNSTASEWEILFARDAGSGVIEIGIPRNAHLLEDFGNGGTTNININKRGRRIGSSGAYPNDYKTTGADLSVSSLAGADVGDPAKIRVYQVGATGEALADILSITAHPVEDVDFPVDFELKGSQGTRRIYADLWDPSGSGENNTASVKGSLNLFIRPITTT